jgi:hypothetical protein
MPRRAFVVGLGSAAAWPMTATAQLGTQVRRLGVLIATPQIFPQGAEVFQTTLRSLGWMEGRNLELHKVRYSFHSRDGLLRLAKSPPTNREAKAAKFTMSLRKYSKIALEPIQMKIVAQRCQPHTSMI